MRPTDLDESEARAEYLAALKRLHRAWAVLVRLTDFDESEARAEYLASLKRLHLAAAARLERSSCWEGADVLRADCDELAEWLTAMRLCAELLATLEGSVVS